MPLTPKRNNSAFSHESPTSSFIRASQSSDCLAVRMPPAGMVLKFPLDTRKHAADAKAKNSRFKPQTPDSLLHRGKPVERLLGGANAARWLEAHRHSRFLRVLANGARHDQADGKRGIDGFFARRCFNEVRSGHHRYHAAARHVAQRQQITGAKDHLQMRGPAGMFERGDLDRKSTRLNSSHLVISYAVF